MKRFCATSRTRISDSRSPTRSTTSSTSISPTFVVRIDDGHGEEDPLNLILEVTGERKKEKEAKTATARTLWMSAVNNHGGFGRWAFLEITDPYDNVSELIRAILARRAVLVEAEP